MYQVATPDARARVASRNLIPASGVGEWGPRDGSVFDAERPASGQANGAVGFPGAVSTRVFPPSERRRNPPGTGASKRALKGKGLRASLSEPNEGKPMEWHLIQPNKPGLQPMSVLSLYSSPVGPKRGKESCTMLCATDRRHKSDVASPEANKIR